MLHEQDEEKLSNKTMLHVHDREPCVLGGN